MLIDGHATDEVDERGRPILGDTLLLILNAASKSRFFRFPKIDGADTWEELLNTARPDVTRTVKAPGVNLVAHSLILLRHSD
jgi:glycogen operon protein